MRAYILIGCFTAMACFLTSLALIWGSSSSCHARWKGFQPEFSIMGGCTIIWHGVRVLSDRVRFIE